MKIKCPHCFATYRCNPLKDRCPKCKYKAHRNLDVKEILLSLVVPGYGWVKTFKLWKSIPVASVQSMLLGAVSTSAYLTAFRALLAME